MKRLLSMIATVLLAVLAASAQNGTLDPTNPPEPQLKYKLTVKAQPAEAASTSGSGEYAEGTKVTVRASAKSNYVFKHWMKGSEQQSQTSTSFSINMPAEDVTYTAVFEYQKPEYNPANPAEPQVIDMTYPLNLVAEPASGGSFNRTSGSKVKEGSSVSIKATPATGYVFAGWYNAKGESLGTNATLSYTMPSEGATLTARFTYNPNSPSEPAGSQDGVDNSADAVTLTARNYTREYGEANPSFGYDVTNGNIASGTPTISCSATKTSPAGTYDIVIAKGSVSNSTVNLVKGTLTITKAQLTISAGNYTKQEGEANPTFSPTFSGFKNGETNAVLTKQPVVGCTANTNSAAGTYPVTVSGAEAQNYSIAYQDGTLTITAKPQPTEVIIRFADATVKQICVSNWDENGDGELSTAEAAAVTSLNGKFAGTDITSFAELQYFEGLTALEDNAFITCKKLTTLTIPKNVAQIGESVFANCISLANLTVDEGNAYFAVADGMLYSTGMATLVWCPVAKTGEAKVDQRCLTLRENAFYSCSKLTSVVLPEGLETINMAVFVGCSSLKTLHIPAKVKSIGMGGFTGCSQLESITVDAANTSYTSVDGVLYDKSKTTLLAYPCKKGTKYTVVSGTANIEPYAFCMTEIEEVELPATLTQIGSCALAYCESLAKVTVRAEKPIALTDDVFSKSTYSNATLYVPKGSKSLYQQANGWKNFLHIEETASNLLGDLTGDNKVDGMDLVALVNIIMGTSAQTSAADLNGDGRVDGMDYVAMVNIIMGKNTATARGMEQDAHHIIIGIEPLSIAPGESRELTITLRNEDLPVTLAQMDMTLPQGLTLTGDYSLSSRTTERDHQLYMSGHDGRHRLMLASPMNSVLTGSEGAILHLTLTADESFEGGDIVLRDVLCVSPDLQTARQQQAVFHLTGTTGITANRNSQSATTNPVYSLSGQRLAAPRKGVNIIGGKKYVVK